MTPLAEQLETFWRCVRTSPGPSNQRTVFRGDETFSAEARLGVYRTAYWVRQVEVLRELFPTVVRTLGDGPFAREASRYLQRHPSTSRAIEDIGAAFPDALEPELAFLARVDWARWVVLVAPDSSPLSAIEAHTFGLDALELRVCAHVEAVAWPARPAAKLIWRRGFEVFERDVSVSEAELAIETKRGLSFSAWCERLAGDEAPELAAPRVLTTFQWWLDQGFFRSVR